jgi:hypothetical protein
MNVSTKEVWDDVVGAAFGAISLAELSFVSLSYTSAMFYLQDD